MGAKSYLVFGNLLYENHKDHEGSSKNKIQQNGKYNILAIHIRIVIGLYFPTSLINNHVLNR